MFRFRYDSYHYSATPICFTPHIPTQVSPQQMAFILKEDNQLARDYLMTMSFQPIGNLLFFLDQLWVFFRVAL
jgi:hypothetical protein